MNEIVFAKLKNASKIIIGLSGGADSIALTHILFTAFGTQRLLAAHVNHGIRGAEGDRDERFVADFCESRNISLEICHEDIPQKAKALHLGLEECGRQCRYEFFQSLCTDDRAVIATAHQADDNAETVLLNLMRGTGLHGLCGIPPIRDNIVRPLLSLS
ncbi:MAG: tRNA lysidine(34) synthetase TilS, partial [Oscillospiraceae bacterium]